MKFMQGISRLVVLCALALLLSPASHGSDRSNLPDLTASVWNWVVDDRSFDLTFSSGRPEPKGLVAILKGWGEEPLELRGEYSEDTPKTSMRLTGNYEGETLVFELELNPGDHEQGPFLSGEFSVGSYLFSVFAGCTKQCPDVSLKKSEEVVTSHPVSAETDLVGEWQDISEAIGFNEYWSITSSNGQWQIAGRFVKGTKVVGSFHSEETIFDSKKGALYFQQVFDQKPDEDWIDSNGIEATVQGNTLKIKVNGVEATLTRVPESNK